MPYPARILPELRGATAKYLCFELSEYSYYIKVVDRLHRQA